VSTTTLPPLPERVARGAALLDQRRPGWAELVDPDRLDMQLEYEDVLGQLYGTFAEGINSLAGHAFWPDPAAVAFAVAHGFELGDDQPGRVGAPRHYAELTGCWRAKLTHRRGGGAR
jgi:hypothetical protein